MQRGIEWADRYTILINPFPIFPRHLTVPDTSHTDQLIDGRIADMIRLAAELDEYTVFYNGPRCGASAPDHTCTSRPATATSSPSTRTSPRPSWKPLASTEGATLAEAAGLPLRMFVIDTTSPEVGQQPSTASTPPCRARRREGADDEHPLLRHRCRRASGSGAPASATARRSTAPKATTACS